MLDLSKLSSYLLADLRARLSPSSLEDDTTADDKIAALTPERAFHHYCDYNGLINHSDNLIRTIDSLRAAEVVEKEPTFDQVFLLFQKISQLETDGKYYCKLEFDPSGAGSLTHFIKETLYFEDEDGIMTGEMVEWKNFREAVDVMTRYIEYLSNKEEE